MRNPRRDGEAGFALLFVFAMAAIVAIMLYLEMPRVAFEAQLGKEDLLIQRGEQYKRAIKLYVRRFNKYPGSIEQLENTNNVRFLRRRYKDPMTGKDEWRFIHSAGGVFPDSLTQRPPAMKGAVDIAQLTGGDSPSPGGDNAAQMSVVGWRRLRGGQRPGAQIIPSPGTDSGSEENPPSDGQPADYPPQGTPPGEPDASGSQPDSPQPAQPGEATPGPVLPPGQLFPGQPLSRGQASPGQLPYAQQPINAQSQGQNVGGMTVTGGLTSPGAGFQTGTQALPSGNPALNAIQRQLTGGSASSFPGNTNIGAGIAGVASKSEGEGIKSYNDHTKYKEWEFIYDPRKDIAVLPAGAAAVPAFSTMPTTTTATKPSTGQN